jgi:hypothetical protein
LPAAGSAAPRSKHPHKQRSPSRAVTVCHLVGKRVALELRPTVRQVDDQIDLEASTTVDQRQLGMTWSRLGMARRPSVLTVHAHLRRQR